MIDAAIFAASFLEPAFYDKLILKGTEPNLRAVIIIFNYIYIYKERRHLFWMSSLFYAKQFRHNGHGRDDKAILEFYFCLFHR